MSVNGISGMITGNVAYADESKSSFNAVMQYPFNSANLIWSDLLSEAQESVSQIANDSDQKANLESIMSGLPFISSFSWTQGAPTTGKAINDVVFHLSMNITFSDNTKYPISVTYEKGERRDHLEATDTLSADPDKAEAISLIEAMLDSIMETVSLS